MSRNPDMVAAMEDAGRVVKRQRLCGRNSEDYLDRLMAEITRVREGIEQGEVSDINQALEDVQRLVDREGLVKNMSKETKDLHTAIAKLGKSIDKYFLEDICRGTREISMEDGALNQVIAEHLFKEGRFTVGGKFVKEIGIPEPVDVKQTFESVHKVLTEIRAKNLDPVLEWAEDHRAQLSKGDGPSNFEFQLHRLRFLHILKEHGQDAALRYCREHFQCFIKGHMPEIQKLMGYLVFNKHPKERSPYPQIESAEWEEVAAEFMRQACNLMGQPYRSPLLVCVGAGSVALPQILKMAGVMESRGKDIKECLQLPLELKLGSEFQFHSIFACPVSKDQSSPDNPPMLMPCGHVLCKQSIIKISKQKSRAKFKCPYCPMEAVPVNCRQLIFPDIID